MKSDQGAAQLFMAVKHAVYLFQPTQLYKESKLEFKYYGKQTKSHKRFRQAAVRAIA